MTGPGGKPRVAVAGCGCRGKNLVRNSHQPGALAAVCGPRAAGPSPEERLP